MRLQFGPDPTGIAITRGRAGAQVRAIQRACEKGRWVRVAAGIYLQESDPLRQAALVRSHWLQIVGSLAPGAVVSHRSAFDPAAGPGNVLILSHPTRFNRSLPLPGLRVMLVRGPAALPGDEALPGGLLHRSSIHRMLLENLGRRRGALGRALGQDAVARRLEEMLPGCGPAGLQQIRLQARQIAADAGLDDELETLEALIDALAGPAVAPAVPPSAAVSGAGGEAADEASMALLQWLADWLRTASLPDSVPPRHPAEAARAHLAFVEAYFSSSAAGHGVAIEQARDVVFAGLESHAAPAVFKELCSEFRMARHAPFGDAVPPYGPAFAQGLLARHEILYHASPEAAPGRFRSRPAVPQATGVPAERIAGTLTAASVLARGVPEGLPRAAFYAIALWRVRPFEHGTEKIARLIMNAELAAAGRARILVPGCLRERVQETRDHVVLARQPDPCLQLLARLQRWSAAFDGRDLDHLIAALRATGALLKRCPDDGLRMPGSGPGP
jgi:hypothetical protein